MCISLDHHYLKHKSITTDMLIPKITVHIYDYIVLTDKTIGNNCLFMYQICNRIFKLLFDPNVHFTHRPARYPFTKPSQGVTLPEKSSRLTPTRCDGTSRVQVHHWKGCALLRCPFTQPSVHKQACNRRSSFIAQKAPRNKSVGHISHIRIRSLLCTDSKCFLV